MKPTTKLYEEIANVVDAANFAMFVETRQSLTMANARENAARKRGSRI